MKRSIFIIFLFFQIPQLQSQNVIVIDSVNHQPIPFVNIQFSKNSGTYTNENGFFEVNKKSNDTIRLTHISYNDFEIFAFDIRDTIVLSPNAILLKEVTIAKGKKTIKFIDFPRKKSNFSSWPVNSKSELVTFVVPNNEIADAAITKLDFKFEKKKFEENAYNLKTAFRINIYSSKNKEIKNKMFSSEVFIIDTSNKDQIEIDMSNEYIELSKNGIFIGVEVIGNIDEAGNISDEKSSVRPILTGNTIKDYSTTTYLKYTFKKRNDLKPINDIIEKTSQHIINESLQGKVNRNLSFGMTISQMK